MPLDERFYQAVAPLYHAGMGTEHVGPLLYSLVRMTRPRRALEVGLGYTTAFIAQALRDNVEEFAHDRQILDAPGTDEERRLLLDAEHYQRDYQPQLHAIDDFSDPDSSGPAAVEVVRGLGLEPFVVVHQGDFRGRSQALGASALPFDMVWFDCGGLPEYVDFIEEYWPLISPDHGLLLLHFTYWKLSFQRDGVEEAKLISGPIVNEIKRQQLKAGMDGAFEVLSLVEPHKLRQGSVTLVRRLPWTSMCRDRAFEQEVQEIFGQRPKPFTKLQ